MRKGFIKLICCLIALLMLTSCGAAVSSQPKYDETDDVTDVQDDAVVNSSFKMALNRENYGIILTKLSTGEIWGTSPISEDGPQYDELGMPITNHPEVESSLKVTFRNEESRTDDILLSYTDAVQDGKVSVQKQEKGFIIEYYFPSAEIMVPVEYELLDDSVRISVDPTKIQENENRVVQIDLAPFWASCKNDNDNSYLFVPSGSGTILDTKSLSANGNTYSAQVYGEDMTIEKEIVSSNTKEIRLPVYGAKNGSIATLAVIEEGEESALITSNIGATKLGYSAVYTTFQLRGYTNHIAKMFSSSEVKNRIYSEPMIEKCVSVRYFPLSGNDADYSGMARCYRNYLDNTYGKVETVDERALNVTLLGGKMVTKSFLGIPYETLSVLTSLSEAEEIVSELNKQLNGNLQLVLNGFSKNGVDIAAVGGSFRINKKLGTEKQLKELTQLCKKFGMDSYVNYDIIRFNKSSGGFNVSKNAVYNVGELKAIQYDYDIATKSEIESSAYYLLTPSSFKKAADKLISKTKKAELTGISLDTLSNMAYSNYSNKESAEYYSKSGMSEKATEVFKALAEEGKKILGTDANLYAAVLSDAIVEAPVSSSKDYSFGYDIPFYSMVFKGRVSLYCESINLASDASDVFLHAIEGGMGIGYTVISNWNNLLINSQNISFYNCVYSDLEQEISVNALKIADYLKKTEGSKIKSHSVLSSGLRETVFENGVTAYVNYSDTALASPAGEVAAHDYLVLEKLP